MADPTDVTITLSQGAEGVVYAEIWSPAFVDQHECMDLKTALSWVQERLDGVDPFEPAED